MPLVHVPALVRPAVRRAFLSGPGRTVQPATRVWLRRAAWLIGLAVLAVVTWLAWQQLRPAGLAAGLAGGNGRIEAVEVNIAAREGRRIREILVNEGDFASGCSPGVPERTGAHCAARDPCMAAACGLADRPGRAGRGHLAGLAAAAAGRPGRGAGRGQRPHRGGGGRHRRQGGWPHPRDPGERRRFCHRRPGTCPPGHAAAGGPAARGPGPARAGARRRGNRPQPGGAAAERTGGRGRGGDPAPGRAGGGAQAAQPLRGALPQGRHLGAGSGRPPRRLPRRPGGHQRGPGPGGGGRGGHHHRPFRSARGRFAQSRPWPATIERIQADIDDSVLRAPATAACSTASPSPARCSAAAARCSTWSI